MLGIRDIWLLDLFVAVVDEGSMSAAARRRHLTPPTVSEAVTKLELLVGDQLLIRSAGGCRPTERGVEVLASIRRLLTETEYLLHDLNRADTNAFRVGTPCGSYGPYLAAISRRLVREGKRDFTLKTAMLAMSDPAPAIIDGSLDLALLPGPTAGDDQLDRHYVFTEPRIALVPVGLVDADQTGITLAELDRHVWPRLPTSADQDFLGPWVCADVRPGLPPRQGPASEPASHGAFGLLDWAFSRDEENVFVTIAGLADTFLIPDWIAMLPVVDVQGWHVDVACRKGSALPIEEVAEVLRASPPAHTHVDPDRL